MDTEISVLFDDQCRSLLSPMFSDLVCRLSSAVMSMAVTL